MMNAGLMKVCESSQVSLTLVVTQKSQADTDGCALRRFGRVFLYETDASK